jgi:molybdate transport system substrate-binding protein
MKKRLMSILVSAMMLFALLAGCGTQPAATSPSPSPSASASGEEVELYVSAAASLTDVFAEIADAYKTVAPNVKLTFTFNSSGTLQTQIEEGAPADVFVSAALKQMNALDEKDLVASDTIKNLLVNKVVLIVPKDSTADIKSFEDVATDKVSMVAVGESSVPVGQYTEEVYTSLNLWDKVKAKANFGSDVRAVLSWVESGDVDCGIVYATDAASTDKVKVVCEAPEGSHKTVVYPAAVLKNSTHAEEAKAFVDFLSSDEAVSIFETAGFTMNTAS